jgi:hypothetical protein
MHQPGRNSAAGRLSIVAVIANQRARAKRGRMTGSAKPSGMCSWEPAWIASSLPLIAITTEGLFDIQIGTQGPEAGWRRPPRSGILVNPFLIFRPLND